MCVPYILLVPVRVRAQILLVTAEDVRGQVVCELFYRVVGQALCEAERNQSKAK